MKSLLPKPKRKVMYAIILRAKWPTFWYANKIGKIYKVYDEEGEPDVQCATDVGNLIYKADCVLADTRAGLQGMAKEAQANVLLDELFAKVDALRKHLGR